MLSKIKTENLAKIQFRSHDRNNVPLGRRCGICQHRSDPMSTFCDFIAPFFCRRIDGSLLRIIFDMQKQRSEIQCTL